MNGRVSSHVIPLKWEVCALLVTQCLTEVNALYLGAWRASHRPHFH